MIVSENVNVTEIDEELELAHEQARIASQKLGKEILSAIGRLAALYSRVIALPVHELDRGDIDGDDAGILFGIQMLEPVDEDLEYGVLSHIIKDGSMGEGGETFIAWAIADVESRLDSPPWP